MNINYLVTLIGITVLYLIIIFLIFNKGMSSGGDVTNFKNVISIIALIANILVVVGFFVTFMLFYQEQKVIIERTNKALITRQETLEKEVAVNISVSDEILKYDNDSTILPESKFELAIIESFLKSGDIQGSQLIDAWNLYRNMKMANGLLNKAIQVQYYEYLMDPKNTESRLGRQKRIRLLKKGIMDKTNEAKKVLQKFKVK